MDSVVCPENSSGKEGTLVQCVQVPYSPQRINQHLIREPVYGHATLPHLGCATEGFKMLEIVLP